MIARALSTHHGLVQVQVREFNADGTLDEASTSEPFSYTAGNPAARADGVLLTGFMNPDIFIFDVAALDEFAEFVVRHRLPFSTLDLTDAERSRCYADGPIEYSHSLTEQLGGQLAAGFVLTHLAEAPHHADATARYMPGYIVTRAIKHGGVVPSR